jgi:hypothetical protein
VHGQHQQSNELSTVGPEDDSKIEVDCSLDFNHIVDMEKRPQSTDSKSRLKEKTGKFDTEI